MALSDFEELEDRMRLLIEGGRVEQWGRDDSEFVLALSWPPGQDRTAEERVEVSAAVERSRIEGEIAVGARVREVILWNDGRLSIEVDTGSLEVEPASAFEAWEIRGPGLAVAPTTTGEQPSIWVGDGDDKTLTREEAASYLKALDARLADGTNGP